MFWFFAKFAFCSSRSTRSCLQAVMDSFLSRMFWMFSWTSRLNQKPLFLEFSGFYILFSFQGSLRCLSSNFYSLSKVFAFVNTFLFFTIPRFFEIFLSSSRIFKSFLSFRVLFLSLSQGRMLWYQSIPGKSSFFLNLLFYMFFCDF